MLNKFSCFYPPLAALLISSPCMALPFNSFDTRSMAMGGAGTAVATADTAALYNPALLSIARYSDDFTLLLPSVSVYAADPQDLSGKIDAFQSGKYVDTLQTSVSDLNTAIAGGNFTTIGNAANTVSTNLNTLSSKIDTLNNRPVSLDGNLTAVIGIPNKTFGIALYANSSVTAGGVFQYKDTALLSNLSTQASCIATGAGNSDAVAIANCGTPSFTSSSLQSTVVMRGILLKEVGLAMSREFYINGKRIALGITPKMAQAQIYDVPIGINSPSLSNFNENDYKADYSIPNFDFGIAHNHRTGWRSGLVIKNVIPYFLDFKKAPVAGGTPVATGEKLRLIPQTRIGTSYTTKWTVIALDMDLYRNDPVGLENYTQYISLGGELSAWGAAQIRAGYRADLVSSSRNIVSFGLGLSPFGIHVDLAVAGNSHEAGGAVQLGFRF